MSVSERTALLSDIHGNSPALEAVLDDVRGVECTRIFVLGDVINGIDPSGCLALLKGCEDVACLKGNAELYLLTPELDRFSKRDEHLYRSVIDLLRWWQARISDEDVAWMQRWPDLLLWNGAYLAHDSPVDRLHPEGWHVPDVENKYQELCYHARGITSNMPDPEMDRLLRLMEERAVSTVFCGHTHVPFCRQIADRLICNVGSVGMPLDGDPRSSWVLVEKGADGQHAVTIRRVSYDVERIQHMVDETQGYPGFESPDRKAAYKARFVKGRIR
jgi:predicted phosphodiesterase